MSLPHGPSSSLASGSLRSRVFATAGGSLAGARAADRTVRFWDPASGTLKGVLLDEDGVLFGISTGGDVKHDPGEKISLIAIVETQSGQETLSPEAFAKKYGWKNNSKVIKLPMRN